MEDALAQGVEIRPHVLFLEVADAAAKKECLGVTAARYFLAGWRLLFNVENESAAAYLDQLLWSYPPEAMLPHSISQKATSERIVITCHADVNVNQAELVFNLHAHVAKPQAPCRLLIELWDTSSPQRTERSTLHWQQYQQQGLALQRKPWQEWLMQDIIGKGPAHPNR